MRFLHALIPILLVSCDRAASDEISNYDVLFLGNSYTQQNSGVDQALQRLFNNADTVSGSCSKLTGGGLSLSQHAVRWEGSGLDTNTYDFVILQDQSKIPSFPTGGGSYLASLDGAIILDERVENAEAETIFFLTWGHRYGDTGNTWRSPDYLSMQDHLVGGYRGYAEAVTEGERKPYIAPVGLAFLKIYNDIVDEGGSPVDEGLFADLYKDDNYHPSNYATYLAACVFFSTITGASTVGMPDNFGIDDITRLTLQEAADWAVFDDTTLGYEYPWGSPNAPGPGEIPLPPMLVHSDNPNEPGNTTTVPDDTVSVVPDSGTTKAMMFRCYKEIFLFGIPLLIGMLI